MRVSGWPRSGICSIEGTFRSAQEGCKAIRRRIGDEAWINKALCERWKSYFSCQKDKVPLPDCDCAAHVGVATQNSVFTVETPLYEKLITQLPKL